MKTSFVVTGMSCSACSAHVEKAVSEVHGVTSVSVSLLLGSMTVIYDESEASPDDVILAVVKAGYGASVDGPDSSESIGTGKKVSGQENATPKRLLLSSLFTVPVIYMGMGHMAGLPLPSFADPALSPSVYCVLSLLFALAVIIINRQTFITGATQLFMRAPGMDTLISTGSAVSFVYSSVRTVLCIISESSGDISKASSYAGVLYFESSAMILTLILIGKTLEAGSKKKTAEAINRLIALRPITAVLIDEKGEHEIPVSLVRPGDTLILRTGQTVPVDGVLESGTCDVSEAMITGESVPVTKVPGDTLYQATGVCSGYGRMTAGAVGSESYISRLIRLVEEASSSKAPIARLADRVSGIFVPTVLLLAAVTFAVWLIAGYPVQTAVSFAVAVIVISCPCSLGLATPTAIMAGTGRGAELGILFRSAEALERLHCVDTVAIDKTGTLTTGILTVTDFEAFSVIPGDRLKQEVASLEALSEHPIGKALASLTDRHSLQVSDFSQIPGGGVSGTSGSHKLIICSMTYAAGLLAEGSLPEAVSTVCHGFALEGKTPVIILAETDNEIQIAGYAAVSDPIKTDAAETVAGLKAMGINVLLITGDNSTTAQAIASEAGISDVIAGVKPDEKDQKIAMLRSEGHITAMVGDGINDAPALSRADVGITVEAGTDIAIDTADVILTGKGLGGLVSAIRLSRLTMRRIKQNLFWALFYNVLMIPMAAGVFFVPFGLTVNPMAAAALMSCSSLFVVTNALRLRYFEHDTKQNDPSPTGGEGPQITETDMITDDKAEPADKSEQGIRVTVMVEGMMCIHCKAYVEEAFNAVEGIRCTVNLDNKKAELLLSKDFTDEELEAIVTESGYEPAGVIRDITQF